MLEPIILDERLKGPWQINYSKAPNQSMVAGIKRYVEHGIMPGHFLTALFSDKLTDTFARADGTNTPLIKEWVQWIYNEMPSNLVGSLERMASHVLEIQKQKEEEIDMDSFGDKIY
jgi:hypothetical protein